METFKKLAPWSLILAAAIFLIVGFWKVNLGTGWDSLFFLTFSYVIVFLIHKYKTEFR